MSADTILMIAGFILTLMTVAAYWMLWPRGGIVHSLLKTRAEPFVMVGLTTGLVLGAGMIFAGLVPG